MTHRIYTAREVGALRRIAGPIHAAIDAGDIDLLTRLALKTDSDGHHRVDDKIAMVLKAGYPADKSSNPDIWSVAERCLFRNRPDMLRLLLEARRPALVNGRKTDSPTAWLRHLCSRFQFDEFARTSLAASADWNHVQHAVPFYKIVIEYDPDDESLNKLSMPGTASAAHVMQARMEMQIDSQLTTAAADPLSAATAMPKPRATRHV
ncbi:hypothetical protein ABIC83_002518 [Roseateles asaccharophilus]|uniref:hypothetical protein n=1 Tax=Roseateles asaccharophilus TaxID=582607 RepID=UPI003832C9ED